jgi:hypothetical protein
VHEGNLYFTIPAGLDYALSAIMPEVALKASASKSAYPRTYAEAMTRPDAELYYQAALKEIDSLLENKTWEVKPLPPGRKAIGCRWVLLIKHKAGGSVDRYKARLVAQGFSQRPGLDFKETHAATLKWATLRAILALAAFEDMFTKSVNITSAFLHGDIDEGIYLKQPEGFPQGKKEDVMQALKGIYGLKQGPRIWHQKLDSVLSKLAGIQEDPSERPPEDYHSCLCG